MKDLGEIKQCVGININRDRKASGIMLDQEQYINQVLERFGMSACKPVHTPIEVIMKFHKKPENKYSNFPYREAVGCLIYLAQVARPDITYAVNKLSQCCNDPGIQHWLGVKMVMRYLQGTQKLKLCYVKHEYKEITGYCDAARLETHRIEDHALVTFLFLKMLPYFGIPVNDRLWRSRQQRLNICRLLRLLRKRSGFGNHMLSSGKAWTVHCLSIVIFKV
ncbi:unnamed protein product [Parnassius mnemosyne]|uniref:Reverse transcriptase Ty1/copia-type domain-containing protein n=1 Tax=Parnassius mnemosyne TaxID=213953 RepID=A0AAV1M4V4_9NEOP